MTNFDGTLGLNYHLALNELTSRTPPTVTSEDDNREWILLNHWNSTVAPAVSSHQRLEEHQHHHENRVECLPTAVDCGKIAREEEVENLDGWLIIDWTAIK